MLILAPIPVLFPFINILLVSELHTVTFQLLFCSYWRIQKKAKAERRNENTDNEVILF